MVNVVFDGTKFDVIESSLCQWIRTLLPESIFVYKAYAPTPRPSGASVTLYLKDIKQIGFDYVGEPDIVDGVELTQNLGVYELTYSVIAYGGEPFVCMKTLQAVRQGLQNQSYNVLKNLTDNQLAFLRFQGGAMDVSTQQSWTDSYMTRALSQDIVFSATNIYADEVGQITTVNATQTLYNESQQVVFSESFSVTSEEGM